jgi:hypothetical protein
MAERFPSLKNLTQREASIIDGPLFLLQDIIPAGSATAQVLVMDSSGRVGTAPRSDFSGGGASETGSVDLTLITDGGNLVRTLPDETLAILGGSNITTGTSGTNSLIILDDNISLTTIQLQQSVATDEALVIKNTSGETQLKINQNGVLQLSPKSTAPTAVNGGLYYQSGSGVEEAFFIGVSTESGGAPTP